MNFEKMIKVYILDKFVKRVKGLTSFYVGEVVCNLKNSQVVSCLCYQEELGERLQEVEIDSFIAIHNVMVNLKSEVAEVNLIKTTRISKLFLSTTPFDLNTNVIHKFRYPEPLTVDEIMESPSKRRVTLNGQITSVQTYTTPTHRRQVLTVADTTKRSISVTLWEDAIHDELVKNSVVTLKNMEVQEYESKKKLNSTCDTVVETKAVETKIQIFIDCKDPTTLEISDDAGNEYTLTQELYDRIEMRTRISAVVHGTKIVDFTVVQPEDHKDHKD